MGTFFQRLRRNRFKLLYACGGMQDPTPETPGYMGSHSCLGKPNRDSLRDVIEVCRQFSDIELVIKPHNDEDIPIIKKILKEYKENRNATIRD